MNPKADIRTVAPARFESDRFRTAPWSFSFYEGTAGFAALRFQWDQLLERGTPHFFQQGTWFRAALAAWPRTAQETLFVVASRGTQPIAICPLQRTSMRVFGLPVRVLRLPDPNAVSYPDFIGAPGPESTGLLRALLDELRSRRPRDWDLLLLDKVYASSLVMSSAASLAGDDVILDGRGVCYYFRTDEGMAAITAQMSSGLRKHLRRCRRQLDAAGTVEFVTSRDRKALPALLEEFLDLEASGWKGEHGERTAIRLHPELVAFYSGLLAEFSETGECEINLMRLDGRAIAGQFCLLSGGTWYHLKIAYDENYDKYSPGFVLLEEVLERLCADGDVRVANYLTGADWAERWHPRELGVQRLVTRNRTLSGVLAMYDLRLRRFARERVVPRARRFLRRSR